MTSNKPIERTPSLRAPAPLIGALDTTKGERYSLDKFERLQELERLQSECRALEEKAGLSQVMERAREGRFIPLGALGEKVTPDEYFADEPRPPSQKN